MLGQLRAAFSNRNTLHAIVALAAVAWGLGKLQTIADELHASIAAGTQELDQMMAAAASIPEPNHTPERSAERVEPARASCDVCRSDSCFGCAPDGPVLVHLHGGFQ